MSEALRMECISKRFGNFYANKGVNLDVRTGEVHTLLGENGAGKSTLMNILIGLYQPTEGDIYLNGVKTSVASPSVAMKHGIGMVHQHFMLIEAMTVLENIILGASAHRSAFINRKALRKELSELALRYGLEIDLDKTVTEISVGEQQRVEILKALYRGARILVLDEPTAVLTDLEVVSLFDIVRRLTAAGNSVIFISHKMREVLEISDRITVLRQGATIATFDRGEADAELLAETMIGRKLESRSYPKVTVSGDAVLELDGVDYNPESRHSGLSGISLSIGKGEIVGVAGIDGNGQSQLAQVVTGVLSPESGSVKIKSRSFPKISPRSFIAEGVAHIPEDRNRMGLVGDMSVKENLVLKSIELPELSRARGLRLRHGAIESHARRVSHAYDIRCEGIDQEARNLSGGNQQKIIFARELEKTPDLLVAVHPTRGLDIGATEYMRNRMIEARDQGCGVLLISADFDEILELSDRIVVMYEGKIVGEYAGENPPVPEISLAMAGKTCSLKGAAR